MLSSLLAFPLEMSLCLYSFTLSFQLDRDRIKLNANSDVDSLAFFAIVCGILK